MNSATLHSGKAAGHTGQSVVAELRRFAREGRCDLCRGSFATSNARVLLCPTCARKLDDPSLGRDLSWDLREISEKESREMDPSDLFRLAEKAAVVGQRKADFSQAVEVLGLVARILTARIRRFQGERFREWLASQPDLLEERPALAGGSAPPAGKKPGPPPGAPVGSELGPVGGRPRRQGLGPAGWRGPDPPVRDRGFGAERMEVVQGVVGRVFEECGWAKP